METSITMRRRSEKSPREARGYPDRGDPDEDDNGPMRLEVPELVQPERQQCAEERDRDEGNGESASASDVTDQSRPRFAASGAMRQLLNVVGSGLAGALAPPAGRPQELTDLVLQRVFFPGTESLREGRPLPNRLSAPVLRRPLFRVTPLPAAVADQA
jgi:hypothetical protein